MGILVEPCHQEAAAAREQLRQPNLMMSLAGSTGRARCRVIPAEGYNNEEEI
jgi:hypothetical protein